MHYTMSALNGYTPQSPFNTPLIGVVEFIRRPSSSIVRCHIVLAIVKERHLPMIHATKGNVDISRLIDIRNGNRLFIFIKAPFEAIVVLGMAVAEGIGCFWFVWNILEALTCQGLGHVEICRAIVTGYDD